MAFEVRVLAVLARLQGLQNRPQLGHVAASVDVFIVHHLERDLAVLAPALGHEVAELGHILLLLASFAASSCRDLALRRADGVSCWAAKSCFTVLTRRRRRTGAGTDLWAPFEHQMLCGSI